MPLPRPPKPPKPKPCQVPGCSYPAGKGMRFCGKHGAEILRRLRESAEWRAAGDETRAVPSEL